MKEVFPVNRMTYRSSMLGAMIGDISGSAHEGARSNIFNPSYQFFTRQSTITDDSVLTTAIADWLLHRETLLLKEALMTWARRFPHAGYGGGFKHFVKTGESYHSDANGAAMRVSPVAELASTLEEAISLAKESASPTHGGGGMKGAQAIAAAIFIAKDGVAKGNAVDEVKEEMKDFIEKTFGYNLNMTIDEIRHRSKDFAAKKAEYRRTGVPSQAYVHMSSAELTCPMAIMAVLHSDSYEQAVRLAVSMGGDSDTVAAMAGSIAAQLYGIPDSLVRRALVCLPSEIVDVINAFEGLGLKPSRLAPPNCRRWTSRECIVYGAAPEGQRDEEGKMETILSAFNHHPAKGYPIKTVGKSLEEIRSGVEAFIGHAKAHPGTRFHVRRVGYDKAGYTAQQIAPMFREALEMKNVLLPGDMLNALRH